MWTCSSFLTSVSLWARFARRDRFRDVADHLFLGGGPRGFGGVGSAAVAAGEDGQALLERDAALARVDRCLRDAVAGNGSLLLLEGPAGIGKTRLVLAAGARGRELGLVTLAGAARSSSGTSPTALCASCSRHRWSRRRRWNGRSCLRARPGAWRGCSASRRRMTTRAMRCSTRHSRSCTGSTGCARTSADARRCCSASTMPIGLTTPRCGSSTISGEGLRSCRSR